MSDESSHSSAASVIAPSEPSGVLELSQRSTQESVTDSPFVYKNGSKLHTVPAKCAPYPLSYDKYATDSEIFNERMIYQAREKISVLYDDGRHPGRSLDVGCGIGTWIKSAASVWHSTHFTGFDLCPIQPDLDLLAPDLIHRVTWVHGNFLERWPFDDATFDHIHILGVAKGIPEDKWDDFFMELARVLAEGGAVEYMEEDIIFPRLPPEESVSPPMRPAPPSRTSSDSQSSDESVVSVPDSLSGYDDDHLEKLYIGVFKERGINTSPTSMIPYHLNNHLRQTGAAPPIRVPFPSRPSRNPLKVDPGNVSSTFTASRRPSSERQDSSDGAASQNDSFHMNLFSLSTRNGRPKFVPWKQVLVPQNQLALHLQISINSILSCKEAMWDHLVRKENWSRRINAPGMHAHRVSYEWMLNAYVDRMRRLIGVFELPIGEDHSPIDKMIPADDPTPLRTTIPLRTSSESAASRTSIKPSDADTSSSDWPNTETDDTGESEAKKESELGTDYGEGQVINDSADYVSRVIRSFCGYKLAASPAPGVEGGTRGGRTVKRRRPEHGP